MPALDFPPTVTVVTAGRLLREVWAAFPIERDQWGAGRTGPPRGCARRHWHHPRRPGTLGALPLPTEPGMIRFALATLVGSAVAAATAADSAPQTPAAKTLLFSGKDLSGFTPWLKDTKAADPRRVFRVTEGMLHVTGDGFGYLATERAYRDYRIRLEYKWGSKTDGGKYVRNSGLLLHAIGPDGGAAGTWMSCVEVQLAQGCAGDLIPIRGQDADGKVIPVSFASDTTLGPDKRPRWTPGGTKTVFTGRQLWWKDHDPTFQELLDTRGRIDRESPLGGWTAVECVCERDAIAVSINGTVVTRAYDVTPAAGKILLQCEGFELFVRNFELLPLQK